MKLIEGMKQIKELRRKADDLVAKIKAHSAHLSYESPVYADQKGQVAKWLQAHGDIIMEIEKLRLRVQKTNLATLVSIKVKDGLTVVKCIAAWIHRRKDLSELSRMAWASLTDKNLKEGKGKDTQGQECDIKIVRCYDPVERDNMVSLLMGEPSLIDQTLEVINATTDLLEVDAAV